MKPTVLLFNGRTVANDSEEWREQCEAKTVLKMPQRAQRWDYLRRVEEKRGAIPAIRLQAVMVCLQPTERQRKGAAAALMEHRDAQYRRQFYEVINQLQGEDGQPTQTDQGLPGLVPSGN